MALEPQLPSQMAETPAPNPEPNFLKRRPGRPKKIVDPNEPVKKRVRKKSQAKPATDQSAETKEAGAEAKEGEVKKKRPYKRRAKTTEEGTAGENEKPKWANPAEGDETIANPPRKKRARAPGQDSAEARARAAWIDEMLDRV